jgi:hypothetical protein
MLAEGWCVEWSHHDEAVGWVRSLVRLMSKRFCGCGALRERRFVWRLGAAAGVGSRAGIRGGRIDRARSRVCGCAAATGRCRARRALYSRTRRCLASFPDIFHGTLDRMAHTVSGQIQSNSAARGACRPNTDTTHNDTCPQRKTLTRAQIRAVYRAFWPSWG